jgi:hypothetical protein
MMEMMKNQGKKAKKTVMELMNVVMKITTLVEIVKNPGPIKIMMRGIIRRMVVMTKQMVMEMKQTVIEMITNQGKTVELMVVERRIVVMKKKQMRSWIKKMKQMVKKMMDVVMEIMVVMIIMTKNQQKKVDTRRNQDLQLRILSNQKEKKTALLGFLRKLPKDLKTLILQKQTKTKTRKRKRTTVQDNESVVFMNCVKTYQITLN